MYTPQQWSKLLLEDMKTNLTKILNEAWRITFKNKWLWVFGLVLVLTSSSGGNGGGGGGNKNNSNFNYTNSYEINKSSPFAPNPQQLLRETSQVLGTAAVSIEELFQTISPLFLVTAGIAFTLLLIVFAILGLYLKAWASSALIHGIDQENNGVSLGLSPMSKLGKQKAVEMIKLSIIPSFITLGVTLLVAIPVILLLIPEATRPFGILLAVLVFLVFFVVLLFLASIVYLGSIALVIKNLTWQDAFKEGYRIITKYFIDVILLSCVNCLIGGLVSMASCALIIPIALVGFGAALGVSTFPPLLIIAVPVAVILLTAFITGIYLVSAIAHVFNKSTWVILYKQVLDLEKPKIL